MLAKMQIQVIVLSLAIAHLRRRTRNADSSGCALPCHCTSQETDNVRVTVCLSFTTHQSSRTKPLAIFGCLQKCRFK
uniref:Uncharacterized protein n=1 Tax=Arundo donax TaxID=35708 RepID=A0A0A8ZEL9_ARUDO